MPELILIIEDDEHLAEGLQYNLERAGYEVVIARDGETGLALATDRAPGLVVLDLMLPGISGIEVLSKLGRRRSGLPVIILSAIDEETEKVRGFDLGAVDYVTKPFGLAELLARIRARLGDRADDRGAATIAMGSGIADLDDFSFTRDGVRIALTPTEVEVLRHLLARRGSAVSREELVRSIWGLGAHSTRTLDTHVARLRKKVETDPRRPRHILTVHGVGYRLRS